VTRPTPPGTAREARRRFHRIWSSEWFHTRNSASDKAVAAYDSRSRSRSQATGRDEDAARSARSEARQLSFSSGENHNDTPPGRAMVLGRLSVAALPITDYNQSQLVRMVCWIESDERLRPRMSPCSRRRCAELGFQKRGSPHRHGDQPAIRRPDVEAVPGRLR